MSPLLQNQMSTCIHELVSHPINSEYFTADFTQTGDTNGNVYFKALNDSRNATAEWRMYLHQGHVYADLTYNHNMVLLKAQCQDFRSRIAHNLPIF